MFIVIGLLHVVFAVFILGGCLAAPAALALVLAKAPFIMPELDSWARDQRLAMLEHSTSQLDEQEESDDDDDDLCCMSGQIIHPTPSKERRHLA